MAIWLSEEKSLPHIVLLALVIGLTSQGVLGFVWNHFVRVGLNLEIIIYFLGWLIATVIISLKQRKLTHCRKISISRDDLFLIGLIILAVAVRSIHPLQHMALGQSDAYSHLQFLRNIMDSGFVHNVMYPPGYHWILALPTAAFHLDPYLVARYGGAFFGAGLVLAVYVFVKSIADNPAAIFTAFLVSCFPGLYLLLKTGVGTFANQLGLFFIPAVLYFYKTTEEKLYRESPATYVVLSLSLIGLSVSVPMILIHVILIIFMVRAARLILIRDNWFFRTGIVALAILPALILLSVHLLHAGPVHQQKTMEIITAGGSISPEIPKQDKTPERAGFKSLSDHPYVNLLHDFLSLKRCGLGHNIVNAIGLLLMAISGIFIFTGFRESKTRWSIIGFWGIIASIQTMTGFLQFSGYQREGWSLMIAAACISGIICGTIYCWGRRWFIFRTAFSLSIILSIIGSFIYPPVHEVRASCAEDEIIKVVRDISYRYRESTYWSIAEKSVEKDQESISGLSSNLPLTIITRKMTGWTDSNQGELIPAVIHPSKNIRVMTISSEMVGERLFKNDRRYIVLVDNKTEGCERSRVFFSMIDPRQVKNYIDTRESNYSTNQNIIRCLNSLSTDDWLIKESIINKNLTTFIITPKHNIL
jgi:hypothetical protein